jgi:hypothetical protein
MQTITPRFGDDEYDLRYAFVHTTNSNNKLVDPRGDSSFLGILTSPGHSVWRILFFTILLIVVSGFYMDEEMLATVGSHAKSVHKAAGLTKCYFWCSDSTPPILNPRLTKSKPPNKRRKGDCSGLTDDAMKGCLLDYLRGYTHKQIEDVCVGLTDAALKACKQKPKKRRKGDCSGLKDDALKACQKDDIKRHKEAQLKRVCIGLKDDALKACKQNRKIDLLSLYRDGGI